MEESYTGFKDLFTSNSIISSERASKYLSAAAFRARIFERQSRNMPGMQMINAVYASCELVCITSIRDHGTIGKQKRCRPELSELRTASGCSLILFSVDQKRFTYSPYLPMKST